MNCILRTLYTVLYYCLKCILNVHCLGSNEINTYMTIAVHLEGITSNMEVSNS